MAYHEFLMLTQKDFDEIENLTKNIIKEEIKHLPTKDDFYDRMDQLRGEIKAVREEQSIISGKFSEHTDQIENHDNRISKLEQSSTTI